VDVAGLTSVSFINAIHKAENESGMKGKVIRVTPQRSHASPINRGCRVDIEIETDANEYYRYEIEIALNFWLMIRDIFSASHLYVEKSARGDTQSQMAERMPKIIYINILGHIIRKSNKEMVQPAKFMYTKPPQEVAVDKLSIYNIQLPRVLEMEQDFSSDLYCWCYTLYTAHAERKTVKEVIAMNPALQAYAQRDAGFQQFADRHATVSADPQTRRDYVSWFGDMLREEGRIASALMLAEERRVADLGEAEKKAEQKRNADLAEAEKKRETDLKEAEQKRNADLAEAEKKAEQKRKDDLLTSARNMKNAGVSVEIIAKAFPLSNDEIDNL
jgi:vacuolar-type H+-ATPase subunit H